MSVDSDTLDEVRTRLLVVPLGSGRGGSGATEVEVVIVSILDRNGIEGTGFTFALTGGARAMRSIIDSMYVPKIVGSSLLNWDRSWHELWHLTHRLGRGVALPALSALDIAVWDLRAKRAGLPLFRLLGAHRERVPIYGSGRATHQMSTDELIEGTLSYLQEGIAAVKLRAGALGTETDLARITAVREAVGPSIRLMVDCNERLDYPTAVYFGRALEDLSIFWLEEPLPSDDVAGHGRLAALLRTSLAVGEHLLGRFEFYEYMRSGGASIFMPDVPLVGGVSEWVRIAALAEVHGAVLAPHLFPELHVHLAAAAKACIYVEHFPLIDDLLAETLEIIDGTVAPPNRPGHGILWDDAAINHFEVH